MEAACHKRRVEARIIQSTDFRGCMRRCSLFMVTLALGALAGCGGGGGNSPPPAPLPAPTGLSYPAHPTFVVGTAIAALSPSVTGSASAYSVSPALPAGLALNGNSGVVSGTPTAPQASTNYQVTASNASGSTVSTLAIAINDVMASITFPSASYTLTTGVPVSLTPAATGGAVVTWSVNPALPAGVVINPATGLIAGTPTAVAPATDYVVTAANSGGVATFDLNLSVQSGVLIELGHDRPLRHMISDAATSRMVTVDSDNRAVLWRTDTPSELASSDTCITTCIALAGPTAAFRNWDGFDLRASADGALLARISRDFVTVSWWALAIDGSYLCAGSATDLTCWSSLGNQLFTRAGDYRNGQPFAAVGTLRLARGAAGNQVIEHFTVADGTSTVSTSFASSFHSWFPDGQRFFATAGNTVAIYTFQAIQVDIASVPTVENLGGSGIWFWTASPSLLSIYEIGASSTPAASFALNSTKTVHSSINALAILDDDSPQFSIVDLAIDPPQKTDHTATVSRLSRFTAANATTWAIGNQDGVIFGERNSLLQRFSHGAAWSIAAAGVHIAVSTASGSVLLFDAQTRSLINEIDFPAAKLEFSNEGQRLAMGPHTSSGPTGDDRSLRIYEVPAFDLLDEWPYNTAGPLVARDFSLSGDGLVVGQIAGPVAGTLDQKVTLLDGTPLFSQASTGQPIRLSRDGSRIAIASEAPNPAVGTNIFVNGSLESAAAGWPLGWLDDSRLLVNTYGPRTRPSDDIYKGAAIVNAAGVVLQNCPIPELAQIQPVSATAIYSPQRNSIFELVTGDVLWASVSDHRSAGAVSGEHVVFASGNGATVRIEPR
jgi:hypothetical protein